MATAPGTGLRSSLPLARLAAAGAHGFVRRIDWLFGALAPDLTAHPRRARSALRTAVICALGFGLMAAAHADSLLGPYALWTIASAGGVRITPLAALRYIVITGAMLALSVPMAGQLAEAPWLMLPFLGVVAMAFRYLMTVRRLPYAWVIVEITFLTSFYLVVFEPRDFGVEVAATFGGVVISFILVALFDTVLWPDPADATLTAMLGHSLGRTRARLGQAMALYFAPRGKLNAKIPGFMSDLPAHLAVLERAVQEGASSERRAVLLGAITLEERLHIEVDRLIVTALDPQLGDTRTMLRPEIEATVRALDAALAEREVELARGEILYGENATGPSATLIPPAIAALQTRLAALRPTLLAQSTGTEAANLGAFLDGLGRIGDLAERGLEEPWLRDAQPEPERTSEIDPALVHYSLKVGLAIVSAFVIGFTTQRADLSVIITTVIIAGLPTYGATLNKMLLRLGGNLFGGAVGILAIIVVTPNFETVPVYMLVAFIALFIADYVGLGNGRLAYAGRQMGSAFVFTWAGIRPSEAITTPLYRVWGILLAMVVLTVVFRLLWPEYAGDSMLPRLRKILRATLDLMPGGAAAGAIRAIHNADAGITRQLAELLAVADDARLEGRASGGDPDAIVNVSGTLRRIAHRLSALSTTRLEAPAPALSPEAEAVRGRLIAAMRTRLEAWREHFEGAHCRSSRAALALVASHAPDEMEVPLREFTDRVADAGFALIAGWPTPMRIQLMAELASLTRLVRLFANLDREMARVARPARAPGA
ncbi:MAG TPA: FUSC family protein [Candidatus Binataceae bacterium]|nr:FUSC family protein [Candidatus Binataceae bacterium]